MHVTLRMPKGRQAFGMNDFATSSRMRLIGRFCAGAGTSPCRGRRGGFCSLVSRPVRATRAARASNVDAIDFHLLHGEMLSGGPTASCVDVNVRQQFGVKRPIKLDARR
ncbi:hypothetical protein AKJ09_11135 [Labilithrix luteola]|uniref:Uncharacterized protein n=1 Tax=Labilithrix luteola TaxID=1391654 RepID=A0A0K1QFN7_9BACT|nr:hypothetical protein AKJ09_11135 [Labilithrix luteola]